jgi:hypothetical protein
MSYAAVWNETTAGGYVDWIYVGNSIYDPQTGVGGDSVYGETELGAIYTYYKVLESQVIVDAVNHDVDDELRVSVVPHVLSAALTEKADPLSMAGARTMVCQYGAKTAALSVSAQTMTMLNLTALTNEVTGTATAGNPSLMWYWHIIFHNVSANALDASVTLRIRFRVRYHGLKTMTH